MYKVFLVEDEIVVREGLKTIIPWQQHGFQLIGDASDGETALPEIRRLRPDVLITDIRMPFMDGLALTKIVRNELPNINIVIVSGYDDFEYARTALGLGVSRYLLKPITKTEILKALGELKEKLDAQQERVDYIKKFRSDVQEYEQFSRRRFFEQLMEGHLSVEEIYEKADKLELNIAASKYNVVQFCIQQETSDQYCEPFAQLQRDLVQVLDCNRDLLLFRWSLTTWAVLVKGTSETIDENTQKCVDSISRRCEGVQNTGMEWYVAWGAPVSRLSGLPGCFSEASAALSHRFLFPEEHILSGREAWALSSGNEETCLKELDVAAIDPALLRAFLKTGTPYEVDNFVTQYLEQIGRGATSSLLFSQYLALNTRFACIAYAQTLGHLKEELLAAIENLSAIGKVYTSEQLKTYMAALLTQTVSMRDQASAGRYHSLIDAALRYIDEHFSDDSLSLNEAAKAVNLSPSYLSALFSQEVGQTFTEYVTAKRIERACELLRETDMRSGEIAFAVGYRDAHYFSFLFRKAMGCPPREYRAGTHKRVDI